MFGGLFSGGESLQGAGEAIQGVAEIFYESDREKLQKFTAETDRIRATAEERLAQVAVNRDEARHRSMFVAGWRPFVGWVCGIAMCYHFLLFPLVALPLREHVGYELVDLDWQELSVILLGMLGFGATRAYEKIRGVAKDNMKEK